MIEDIYVLSSNAILTIKSSEAHDLTPAWILRAQNFFQRRTVTNSKLKTDNYSYFSQVDLIILEDKIE